MYLVYTTSACIVGVGMLFVMETMQLILAFHTGTDWHYEGSSYWFWTESSSQ